MNDEGFHDRKIGHVFRKLSLSYFLRMCETKP